MISKSHLYNKRYHFVSEPTGVVTEISSTDVTTDSLTFTWSEVPCQKRGGPLLRYNVEIYNTETGALVTTSRTTEQEFRLEELIPFTNYGIKIQFSNRAGDGPMSEEYVAKTESSSKYCKLYNKHPLVLYHILLSHALEGVHLY